MEKVAATRYEASRLVQLLTELTIEIASRVAAQSEDAMVDLGNLRATCKAMCVVCGAAKVGRRLALRCVLRRRFYIGPEYRATLITGLATVGNPQGSDLRPRPLALQAQQRRWRRRQGPAAPAHGRGTRTGCTGASLKQQYLYETPLRDHFGAVGLGAFSGWCADARASPGRTSVCGRRLWRARRMVCLVLVAQVLQQGVSDPQQV